MTTSTAVDKGDAKGDTESRKKPSKPKKVAPNNLMNSFAEDFATDGQDTEKKTPSKLKAKTGR